MEGYSKRQEKVSRLIQKEIAGIFLKESSLFENAMITVTVVRTSPDLSFCKVYLSIFSPGKSSDVIIKAIQDQKKNLRYALAKRVKNQLKQIPELAFFLDDSLDYIDKIDSLLH